MFGRKKSFDDDKKDEFVKGIASMLEIQLVVVPNRRSLNDTKGRINRRAIGYVYGFVDCALRSTGQDMSDAAVGVPIMFQVLRHLFPGHERAYTDFLIKQSQDPEVIHGMMNGGQQYADFSKPNRKGAPMGLARFLLES